MSTATMTSSRIDDLELEDPRFARKEDGQFKSGFHSRAEDPVSRIREHDKYVEQMRQDGLRWRRGVPPRVGHLAMLYRGNTGAHMVEVAMASK